MCRAAAKHPFPPTPAPTPVHTGLVLGRQAGAKAHTLEAMIKREDSGFRVASVLAT